MRVVLLVVACLLLPGTCGRAFAAANWGALYAYVDWTSEYRFYGLSESNRQPAVQAGLHWTGPENFYAGIFVSRVNFRDFRKTSVEADLYAGRHFDFEGHQSLQFAQSPVRSPAPPRGPTPRGRAGQ